MARNLYAGYCYKCGKYVPVGLGYFEKKRNGNSKWRVQCMQCCNGRKPDENEPIVKRARGKFCRKIWQFNRGAGKRVE